MGSSSVLWVAVLHAQQRSRELHTNGGPGSLKQSACSHYLAAGASLIGHVAKHNNNQSHQNWLILHNVMLSVTILVSARFNFSYRQLALAK